MPLTAAQARVWFTKGLHPSNPIYDVAGGHVDINGPVDAALLVEARRVRRALADVMSSVRRVVATKKDQLDPPTPRHDQPYQQQWHQLNSYEET